MHQTLYLSYRPTDFTQVIGQDHIVAALTAAIKKQKVAHAYLFTGPRGTGKTSIGRLLAKAVNCTQATAEKVICNECAACLAIAKGNSLDVIEIDAASNRGIDDIRALRERVAFPPQELVKKVYIIDEVHMLTTEAFNALLKTLEEPPVHALFILATTEPHKVPITIQSRCQRLDFHRGSPNDLVINLERVAKEEKADIDEAVLRIIAELSEGGYRDSLTLLERALQIEGKITIDKVRDLFGLGGEEMVIELIQYLAGGDRQAVFTVLATAEQQGVHPPYLAQTVVTTLRHLMYAKVGAVAAEPWEAEVGKTLDLPQVRVLTEYWMNAAIDSRRSPVPLLPLEIAAAKWLEKSEVVVAEPVAAPVAVEPAAVSETKKVPEVELSKPAVEIVASAPAAAVPEVNGGVSLVIDSKQWEEIVSLLVKHNHSISKLLQSSAIGRVENGTLPIYVQYPFHRETLRSKVNFEAIANALQAVLKQSIIPDVQVGQPPTDSLRAGAPSEVGGGDVLQNVSDVFS